MKKTLDEIMAELEPLEKEETTLRTQILAIGGNPPDRPHLKFEITGAESDGASYKSALETHVQKLREMIPTAKAPAANSKPQPTRAAEGLNFTPWGTPMQPPKGTETDWTQRAKAAKATSTK